MKIKILESAMKDLERGYYFYNRQLSGLGEYFLDSLFSDIDSLQLFAGIHIKTNQNFYRLLSKKFPFAIYYKIENNETVLVYAVLDCRKNPNKIIELLTKL